VNEWPSGSRYVILKNYFENLDVNGENKKSSGHKIKGRKEKKISY